MEAISLDFMLMEQFDVTLAPIKELLAWINYGFKLTKDEQEKMRFVLRLPRTLFGTVVVGIDLGVIEVAVYWHMVGWLWWPSVIS